MTPQVLPGIGTFSPETERDHAVWTRLAEFVSREPRAFTRDATIGGHVTGSAFVLSPDGRAVLLTHHRKLDIWVQLGGHCDGIADAQFVAMKEAYEESGLARISLVAGDVFDIDIHEIPTRGTDPAHLHYDVRFLMQAEMGEIAVSAESHALAWLPLDGLETVTSEASVLRMAQKVRSGWGSPHRRQ